jgi:hypothetical protein
LNFNSCNTLATESRILSCLSLSLLCVVYKLWNSFHTTHCRVQNYVVLITLLQNIAFISYKTQ